MKYGESTFDILYLTIAILSGTRILRAGRGRAGRLAGTAVLVLGIGDAFHLVPRVLNYFTEADMTAALGAGKFITSVTMTFFYLFLYRLWLEVYGIDEDRRLTASLYVLAGIRVLLCLLPQNRWLSNESSAVFGILRNIPFVAIGAVIIWLFRKTREEIPAFRNIWLCVLLSFLFYIPVAVFAGAVPVLGMLMLPKTVCYILMILIFLRTFTGRKT